MKKIIFFFLLFLISFQLFAFGNDDKPLLAVMEIEDKTGQFYKVIDSATEYLRAALADSNKFIVVAGDVQRAKMRDLKEESYNGAYDENYKLAVGMALFADKILVTRIDSLGGDRFLIISELMDITTETIKNKKTKRKIFEIKSTYNQDLLNALDDIAYQISGNRRSVKMKADHYLLKSDFYGEHEDLNGVDKDLAAKTMISIGSVSLAAGFVTLAFGLWGDGDMLCKGTYGSYDCENRFNKTEKKENIDEIRKKLIISGSVLTGVGVPLFISGLTYAVWDEYTKGERAAGFMISFGALAAAGGCVMAGLADGNKSLLGGGIAAAAVGGGLLIGGITMAILDAKARELKGARPRTSFFVSPTKGGVYAQLGVNF